MGIYEIQKQIATQRSILSAFPSQGPSIEPMYVGENQRAAIEVQIENAKTLVNQDRKLDSINETLITLVHQASQNQILEDERYARNISYAKIAAWSGVGALLLSGISIGLQIVLK